MKLGQELEKSLLKAVMLGIAPVSLLQSDELSKHGKAIHKAVAHLLAHGGEIPLRSGAVLLAAATHGGADRKETGRYLEEIAKSSIAGDVKALSRAAHQKDILAKLINEAGEQLGNGALDTQKLAAIVESPLAIKDLESTSLADAVGARFPTHPSGLEIASLPKISAATNGLAGIWVIGGEPGLGKSTLAAQIAVDLAGRLDVVYYDIDGTGKTWIIERLRHVFENDIKKFKKGCARFFYREDIASLDIDMAEHRAPTLLVIDSGQTLPTNARFAKESLDSWINRFKTISQRGYTLLIISEKPRAEYGEASLGGFKGTGSWEYAGAVCAQLVGEPEDEEAPIEFHIVKNRHGKSKGRVATLKRDRKRVFWFKEV